MKQTSTGMYDEAIRYSTPLSDRPAMVATPQLKCLFKAQIANILFVNSADFDVGAVAIAIKKIDWNWRDEGFFAEPATVKVLRRTLAYRIWGGTASEAGSPIRPGVCLSFDKPVTRHQAEDLLAIWEWGNACRFVTTFEILPGANIFVGMVDPGDVRFRSGMGSPGSQIFVEGTLQANQFVRRVGTRDVLIDDVGARVIVPNRDPGKSRSS